MTHDSGNTVRPDGARHITSADNADFKTWKRLASGSSGRRCGDILLEGEHLCRAWLQHYGPPRAVLLAESLQSADWVRDLRAGAGPRAEGVILQDHLARQLSDVRHGPALFFVVSRPAPPLPEHITQTCLCLDRVQDPGNLGTLLRTAAAAGLTQAFLSTGSAAAWSPKVLRSGQGAHFALHVHEHVDLLDLFEHRLAVPLTATALDGDSLLDADLAGPRAWLFGNEGRGASPALLARATQTLRIPQAAGVESLNVAAAAAVCLFEQRRQQQLRGQ